MFTVLCPVIQSFPVLLLSFCPSLSFPYRSVFHCPLTCQSVSIVFLLPSVIHFPFFYRLRRLLSSLLLFSCSLFSLRSFSYSLSSLLSFCFVHCPLSPAILPFTVLSPVILPFTTLYHPLILLSNFLFLSFCRSLFYLLLSSWFPCSPPSISRTA